MDNLSIFKCIDNLCKNPRKNKFYDHISLGNKTTEI